MTDGIDETLHSDAPLVVIEAAAGCGKTWTAAKFARDMSARLRSERVLLLSHTHAACGEFHRRCEGHGLRVDVETCDSFALKVVAPYAQALGLPHPIDTMIGRTNGISFAALTAKAVDLVKRAPTIARLIGAQYPVIILDEHQDASAAQHELAMILMRIGGSRLRIFGDPMQALHPGTADQYVDWDRLWADCPDRLELTEPHRWKEAPGLGQWVTAARATLRAGNAVVMRDAPPEVQLLATSGLAGRGRFKDHERAGKLLHAFLNGGDGRIAILAHLGDMVRALAQGARWRAGVNEGAVLEHLDRLLVEAEAEGVDAAALAAAFIAFADEIGSGFAKPMREGLAKRAGATLNQKGAGPAQQPWLSILDAIYDDPCHRGLAAAMNRLARSPPAPYRVRLSDHAAALRSLGRTDDARGHLHALSRLRRRRRLPPLSVSTVHKAKGLEFRRVLVCPADRNQYPSNPYGARLLYVAMSRATHRLVIVTDTASPLCHLDLS